MITSYSPGSAMLKRYIELNAIKSAFVFKEGARVWQVYAGDAVARTGFKEGEPFRTMREALEHSGKVNALIESVEPRLTNPVILANLRVALKFVGLIQGVKQHTRTVENERGDIVLSVTWYAKSNDFVIKDSAGKDVTAKVKIELLTSPDEGN